MLLFDFFVVFIYALKTLLSIQQIEEMMNCQFIVN